MEEIREIIDNIGFIQLTDSMGNDLRVVNAARVSFNGESETFEQRDEKLIEYLLKNKHTSPLEHVILSFIIKTPLFIRSQWMRHRMWSFNEISRRYTSEEIEFYNPSVFRKQSNNNKQASTDDTIEIILFRGKEYTVKELMESHSNYCKELYDVLLEQEVAREQARMVLPQNLYTKFYATVDLHNLLHFIDIRNHHHAQFEMRKFAESIEQLAEKVIPETMKIWKKIKQLKE
jgi:thymidylate synthase (FAD)